MVTINRATARLNIIKFQFHADSMFRRAGRSFISSLPKAATGEIDRTGAIDIYNRSARPSFKEPCRTNHRPIKRVSETRYARLHRDASEKGIIVVIRTQALIILQHLTLHLTYD